MLIPEARAGACEDDLRARRVRELVRIRLSFSSPVPSSHFVLITVLPGSLPALLLLLPPSSAAALPAKPRITDFTHLCVPDAAMVVSERAAATSCPSWLQCCTFLWSGSFSLVSGSRRGRSPLHLCQPVAIGHRGWRWGCCSVGVRGQVRPSEGQGQGPHSGGRLAA